MPERYWNIGDNLMVALVVFAALATCAVTSATEERTRTACYEAGHSPEECSR